MIFISAGFDGHAEDDMAHFNLREPDYAWITRELHKLAGKHARSGSSPAWRGATTCRPWAGASAPMWTN